MTQKTRRGEKWAKLVIGAGKETSGAKPLEARSVTWLQYVLRGHPRNGTGVGQQKETERDEVLNCRSWGAQENRPAHR